MVEIGLSPPSRLQTQRLKRVLGLMDSPESVLYAMGAGTSLTKNKKRALSTSAAEWPGQNFCATISLENLVTCNPGTGIPPASSFVERDRGIFLERREVKLLTVSRRQGPPGAGPILLPTRPVVLLMMSVHLSLSGIANKVVCFGGTAVPPTVTSAVRLGINRPTFALCSTLAPRRRYNHVPRLAPPAREHE